MSLQRQMEAKLALGLAPERLRLDNESHMHAVAPGSETHFNLIIVSSAFEGLPRVDRQRRVYAIVADEMRAGVHALTMKTLTPAEYDAAGGEVENPAPKCLGGSRAAH